MKDIEVLESVRELRMYTKKIYNLIMDGKVCTSRDKIVGLGQKLAALQNRLQNDIEISELEDRIEK
jgi:hypothetical protein